MNRAKAKKLSDAINKQKSEWLDGVMKRILPPEFYEAYKNPKITGTERMRCQRWVSKHQIKVIHLDESNLRHAVSVGGKVVSEIAIKLDGDAVGVLVKDTPDLTTPPETPTT